MGVHSNFVGGWRGFSLTVAVGLSAVGMFGASDLAHAISCGDVLGPGGLELLTEDLVCEKSPALIVKGPVVVDLQGFTLACALDDQGALKGTGIRVTGSEAEIRNGKVRNCRRGLRVEGDGNHQLKRLTVTSAPGVGGNDPIGFLVQSNNNRFIRNIVKNYAGEGFRLDGANLNELKRNQAIDNADHGFRVRLGEGNLFLRNTAQGNGGEGFRSQDRDNRFEFNMATNNGDEGIRLRDAAARNNLVIGNTVKNNGRSPCNPVSDNPDVNPGIAVTRDAGNNQIRNNKIRGNCIGIGIEKGSRDNTIMGNDVSNSKLFDLVDGNADCDNNTWDNNKFKTGTSGPFPPDAFFSNFPRGVLFSDCVGDGQALSSFADQGAKFIRDGGSALKDGVSLAKDGGSSVKDAAKSLFD